MQIYKPEDTVKARFELAQKTRMIDFTINVYNEMNGESAEIPKSERPL
jgi:hypothetical protein